MHAYVVGNVTVDETISVAALPEPGASIHGRSVSHGLGGKGANQAVVLGRGGLPTTLIAAVGGDARADMIRRHLAPEPLDCRLIEIGGGSSDVSVVLTSLDGENAIVTTTDAAEALSLADATSALSGAERGDLVILQGNLTHAVTRGVLEYARVHGIVANVNPSPLRPFFADLWPLVDVAFLNKGEASALTGSGGEAAARRLIESGVGQVVLTFGGDGAMLADDGGTVIVPAEPCAVVDTAGAGDTFMATALASAALRGTALDRLAIEHAARAAAITVGRRGTHVALPTAAELAAIFGR